MAVKKTHSIPHTQGRVSQSIDFGGYIYPQIFSSLVSTVGRAYTDFYSTVLSQALGNSGTLIGGVKSVSKTYSRDISEKRILGNYETVQKIPGKIDIALTLDKVQFYKDNNLFDSVLSINYGGAIKQTAPMMIVELMEAPDGEIKSIIHLDCWIKSDNVAYDMDGNLLLISKLNIDVARTFAPIDIIQTGVNLGAEALSSLGVELPNAGNTFDLDINF